MPVGRSPRHLALLLLGALLAVLLPAHTAWAAERTVQGGRLDWGVKSSFQTYVTGPVAKGTYRLSGGAGTVGESLFRFHSAKGTYDPDTGALNSAFGGGVRFVGHQKADGGYELDLTISRPSVRVSGTSGVLHADIRSKARGTGVVSDRKQVPLASLNLAGVDMRGGGSPVALSNVPATLTAEGAKSFAGYYEAGAALDPVSLSVDVTSSAPGASPSEPPAQEKDGKGEEGKGKDSKKADGAIADAALDWGVRRTFREYVSGPIAEGEWKLAEGARDGGALYRFPDGKGEYDAAKGELTAEFAGEVRFTGKDLDITLGKIAVSVKDEKGTLSADDVPLATFRAPLRAEKNLILVEEAETELTSEGAEFFGSMYQKGTAMDPVTLAVALDEAVELPALPDLGSEPAAKEPPVKAGGEKDAAAHASSASNEPAFPILPLSLAAAAVLAAGAALWFVRRRRHATSHDNSEEQQRT